MDWNDDRCSRWSNILGANRRLANAKSCMLQGNSRSAACMYVHASFDTYSDRHALGLLFCAGVIALCCAVLCCARDSDTLRQHTRTYYCCCYISVQHKKRFPPPKWKKAQHCCRKCEDMLALVTSVCLLALPSAMYERDSTANHGTARHSMAQHRTAPQHAAGHDTARHRTVLRCAVELAKLS